MDTSTSASSTSDTSTMDTPTTDSSLRMIQVVLDKQGANHNVSYDRTAKTAQLSITNGKWMVMQQFDRQETIELCISLLKKIEVTRQEVDAIVQRVGV